MRHFTGIHKIRRVFALQVVKMALDVHTSEMAGDVLVFLTGRF